MLLLWWPGAVLQGSVTGLRLFPYRPVFHHEDWSAPGTWQAEPDHAVEPVAAAQADEEV